MTRVLITCPQMQNCFEEFRARFDERGISYDLPPIVQQPTEDELIAVIADYDGMIAGDDPLTARVLDHATRLRIISKWGVGIDGIDIGAAAARGIAVTNTPGVFGEDVADVALGYVIMLARRLHEIHASVANGGWMKHEGIRLATRTLGVSALGTIGRAVARRALAFGMPVVAYDIDEDALAAGRSLGVVPVELDDLFRQSDYLVLCSPLTEATRKLVNDDRLALMRQGTFIVNVARGALVDEEALERSLASGRTAGAALDVFEVEPLPTESPLRSFPHCIFGSHNASNTSAGVLQASEQAVANLLEGLSE